MEIKKGQIVKYTCLPGIFPRIIGLLTSGFSVIANMIAIIYANFGLIPKDHPYLKSENFVDLKYFKTTSKKQKFQFR